MRALRREPDDLRAPGTAALNAGFFNKIHLGGKMRLQAEATFTNVLNHTNFGNPAANISVPPAGIVDRTQGLENAGSRTTRMGLRLDF